jgi:hypothetical protein
MLKKKLLLLGITIDDKLNFDKYSCDLRGTIMRKMYSIKKIFQLSYKVKIQFFKTFIMPHFDYCSSLSMYFAKSSIQRLANVYNYCLNKLLHLKNEIENNDDYNAFNNRLEVHGLNTYEHRLILKLSNIAHNTINNVAYPSNLKSQLKNKTELQANKQTYDLRRTTKLNNCSHQILIEGRHENSIRTNQTVSAIGENTFNYFFSKLINKFLVENIKLKFSFLRVEYLTI